jgi:hypothetical protein
MTDWGFYLFFTFHCLFRRITSLHLCNFLFMSSADAKQWSYQEVYGVVNDNEILGADIDRQLYQFPEGPARELMIDRYCADIHRVRLSIIRGLQDRARNQRAKRARGELSATTQDEMIRQALMPLFRDACAEIDFKDRYPEPPSDWAGVMAEIDPRSSERLYRNTFTGTEIDQTVLTEVQESTISEDIRNRVLQRYCSRLPRQRSRLTRSFAASLFNERDMLDLKPEGVKALQLARLRVRIADLVGDTEQEAAFQHSYDTMSEQRQSEGKKPYIKTQYADHFRFERERFKDSGLAESNHSDEVVRAAIESVCSGESQEGKSIPKELREAFLRYFERDPKAYITHVKLYMGQNGAKGLNVPLDFAVIRALQAKRSDLQMSADRRGYNALMQQSGKKPVTLSEFRYRRPVAEHGSSRGADYSRHLPAHLRGKGLSVPTTVRNNYNHIRIHHKELFEALSNNNGAEGFRFYGQTKNTVTSRPIVLIGIDEACRLILEDGGVAEPRDVVLCSKKHYDFLKSEAEQKSVFKRRGRGTGPFRVRKR